LVLEENAIVYDHKSDAWVILPGIAMNLCIRADVDDDILCAVSTGSGSGYTDLKFLAQGRQRRRAWEKGAFDG
jgi:hypothetical protein